MSRHGRIVVSTVVLSLFALSSFGATFIVPADDELVRRSKAVVSGTVLGSHAAYNANGGIVTRTQIRVSESLKGSARAGSIIEVSAIGGVVGTRALVVPGTATFRAGEEVVLMLDTNRDGDLETTMLTLGKFTRVTGRDGQRLLVRNADEIFGWDIEGKLYKEPTRLEKPFVQFVRDVAAGRTGNKNYILPAQTSPRIASEALKLESNAAGSTYVSTVDFGPPTGVLPARWGNFGTGVAMRNFNTQTNAPNNGIDAITAAIAMWNNELGSAILYTHAGTTGTQQCLNTPFGGDGINGISFEDPCGEVTGTVVPSGGELGRGGFWVDSATNKSGGETYATIYEANVVLNNGLSTWNSVGNATMMNALMAHEMGHSMGWRHSDQPPAGGENTGTAIMRAVLNPFTTLQTYDINAARGVYPGNAIYDASSSGASWGHSDLLWRNYSTGANAYWFMSNGGAFVTAASLPGTADTNWRIETIGDFTGDNLVDIVWRHYGNGTVAIWQMNGTTVTNAFAFPAVADLQWHIVGSGDFNSDGHRDFVWRHFVNGGNAVWFILNGQTYNGSATLPGVQDVTWQVVTVNDMDDDEKPDLVWRNSVTGQDAVWALNGTGFVTAYNLPGTADTNWKIVGSADFSGDGDADLIWRNTATGGNACWVLGSPASGNIPVTTTFTFPGLGDQNWQLGGPR